MGTIETIINGNIATLLFFHPSSNSFPSTLLQQFTDEINTLSKNDSVSIIILKVQELEHFVQVPHLTNYFL